MEIKESEKEEVEEESEDYAQTSSEEDEESSYEEKIIIDSEAAMNIITDTLRKKLGVVINRPSNTIFIMANRGKAPSLGRAEIIIEVENEEIPVEVQVIDS